MPEGFKLTAVTLPQNPGGVANIEPLAVLNFLRANDLLGELDFVPHLSCKDSNADGLLSSLVSFRKADVESLLVLTGDKPVKAKGVFEFDSIGLLQTIKDINSESYLKAKPEALDKVHQFFPAAAVSPFKYTEPSQMQQYYKMEKKIESRGKIFDYAGRLGLEKIAGTFHVSEGKQD